MEKNSLNIKNDSDVDRILKLIEDQSWEWAFGQVEKPGPTREMVANSFTEGAKTVITLLKGDDEYWNEMIKEIKEEK